MNDSIQTNIQRKLQVFQQTFQVGFSWHFIKNIH